MNTKETQIENLQTKIGNIEHNIEMNQNKINKLNSVVEELEEKKNRLKVKVAELIKSQIKDGRKKMTGPLTFKDKKTYMCEYYLYPDGKKTLIKKLEEVTK